VILVVSTIETSVKEDNIETIDPYVPVRKGMLVK